MKKTSACLLISAIFITILIGSPFFGAWAAETCKEWVAKVVSVQGSVQTRRADEKQWVPVKLNDTFCPGDMIRVQERSRAAIVLSNEAVLRLDQKTTVTFSGLEKKRTSLLDLVTGAAHFFSRIPRLLRVMTPFVNAAVKGTEFFVRVERDQTFLSLFEGQVVAANEVGSLTLTGGQSALARAGQAPALRVVVRPRDAVRWALYYPPIVDFRPVDFPGGAETDWQGMARESITFYWEGELVRAFSSLEGAPENIRDPRFFTYRAALLLTVGRVDEASIDIDRALNLDPRNSDAFALQSIIAVVQNEKDRALELATKAVELDPESSVATVALSYAQQSHFDLKEALSSLKDAVKLDPENALAWARLAELRLSHGYVNRALEAAKEAVVLNPNLARTQTVLGFAYLAQIKTEDSKKAFEKAIELDQAAPLPRLGLGLAKIREGDLKPGRAEIEIAASLDPNNSLIRSYLGKAYFEEKRDRLDADQFKIAKELDPLDPTPWFYDAIRKQSVNRPVEALHDLQKSIELNDNRAVYRSRLLLEEDLAARGATLGRIYNELGFQQLALVEGWKSLNTDPSNYSAHRFLADSYAALPRHEIARVSELLQSQLLQPINITPVQPQLAESKLFILSGSGPADPSLNEFNPLFNRDRFSLLVSGVAGENSALGDELVISGVEKGLSFSFGQFHYETEGFRENNDQERDILNLFVQGNLSHKTSVQTEFRYADTQKGDLALRFDPDNFLRGLRQGARTESLRFGFRHALTPNSDIIASAIYRRGDFETELFQFYDLETDQRGYMAEAQHLLRTERFSVISGVGNFNAESKEVETIVFGPFSFEESRESDIRHTNLYVYSLINYPRNVTWTVGGSADFFEGGIFELDRDQFNPKLGLTWNPLPGTTLRAALFRVLKRTLISNQTIEPTQVSGFNQFFDDGNGAESWRYGIAIDQKLSATIFGGLELSRREVEVPFLHEEIPPPPAPIITEVRRADWKENLVRAYLYWTPHPWLAARAEFEYERIDRDLEFVGPELFARVKTYRLPFGINFFHPSGLSAALKITYVDQEGRFGDPLAGPLTRGDDRFCVVDASMGYRFPKRWGLITVDGRNLFDESLKFQDTDPSSPRIYPERLVLAKFTLAF